MIRKSFCVYKKVTSDGYGDTWKTECGKRLYYEAPEEVGFSFAPLPTDNSCKYCSYCGGEIILDEKSTRG